MAAIEQLAAVVTSRPPPTFSPVIELPVQEVSPAVVVDPGLIAAKTAEVIAPLLAALQEAMVATQAAVAEAAKVKPTPQILRGGSSALAGVVGVTDTSATRVNPATKEAVEAVRTAVDQVTAALQGTLSTGALTNTQLRAAPVSVSGPVTDAQLRATPVPISATTAEGLLADIKRSISDYETRLDYDTRTDTNPVYVGKALEGTDVTTASWSIQKLTYDASNRLTRVQVLPGAWSSRAALTW